MVTDGPNYGRSGEQGDHGHPEADGGRGGADLEGAAAVLVARLLVGDLVLVAAALEVVDAPVPEVGAEAVAGLEVAGGGAGGREGEGQAPGRGRSERMRAAPRTAVVARPT